MRRHSVFVIAVMALVGVLALSPTAAAKTKKKKKIVETTVTITHTVGPPHEEYLGSSFSGTVGSTKNRCIGGREVTVRRVNGPNVGQTQSAPTGAWTVPAPTTSVRPGQQYAVEVAKNKFVKEKDKPNGVHVIKKIKCQPVSETITVP